MKVYTEIIYEWKDGGLKEISSESFDYEGEVTQCWGMPNISISIPDIDLDPRTSDNSVAAALADLGTPNTDIGTPNIPQPNLGQFGTGQGGTMGDMFNAMNVNMQNMNQFINQKFEELGDFLNPPEAPGEVTIDPDQSAYSGLTANKKSAELAANKAKSQARGSLRIS